MVKPIVRRICLLCGKRVDSRLLCFTNTKYQNTVVLLSSLVLFNAIDLEEAKRCYGTGARKGVCDEHYIEAAKFMTSELAFLGIRIASYVTQPTGELISYVNEKDIPLHLVDSLQATARKLDEHLDISLRKIRDFLNSCLYRYEAEILRSTTGGADDQQDASGSATKPENDASDVKPTALLCGTSKTTELNAVERDQSTKEKCAAEELEETDPDLLEKMIPVKGDRLLSLFRFCPKCGTQISRKRRRIVFSNTGPLHTVHYICNSCGGKRCWYAT